ncbi:MAG: FAD-dependent oxidoreductase, partial [Nitrososphaeraceae archaeon]
ADQSGKSHPQAIPGQEFTISCSTVLIAIGRSPNSFLQKTTDIKTGKRNAISITEDYETSINGVFAAGDVTSGETLIVKAMENGREGAQMVHEYLMGLEASHVSFYEKYYTKLSYDRMLEGKNETKTPPD